MILAIRRKFGDSDLAFPYECFLAEITDTSTDVTPAKTGVQNHLEELDSGLRRNDGKGGTVEVEFCNQTLAKRLRRGERSTFNKFIKRRQLSTAPGCPG